MKLEQQLKESILFELKKKIQETRKLTGYNKEVYISDIIQWTRKTCIDEGEHPLIYLMYFFDEMKINS